jgi:hypothetical protein
VRADILLSGGYTIPSIRKERSPQSYHEKSFYLGHGVDLLFNESRTFFPYAGVRISQQKFTSKEYFSNGESLVYGVGCIALSAVGGMQYAYDLADRTSLRVAVGAGPFWDIEGNAMRGTNVNAVAEASVGIKWRFVTLGAKLVKPIGAFGHYKSSYIDWGTEGPNDYGVSNVALELKLTPPPRPSSGEFGRPNGPVRALKARLELGVAVGPAMVEIAEQGARDNDPVGSGAIALVTFDMYTDANKHPVCFATGSRIGVDPFGVHFSHVAGFQINTAPKKDLGFRMSAMTGPMLYNTEGHLGLGWTLEGNASLLINHRWSVGVKYMHPPWELDDQYYREPWFGSTYRARYLMGEVKVRFGRR